MEDNLTFDNLYELLEKFSKTSETNKKFAEAMSERISKGINWNKILYLFYFNSKHRGWLTACYKLNFICFNCGYSGFSLLGVTIDMKQYFIDIK